jgi:hypothetical protein
MARVRRATGKKSLAIGDRSGLRVPYTSLKTTWDGLRVEPEDWEPKHPQLDPPRNVVDAVALFQPRPDNDPENATFYVGYNYDPFIDPRQRPPVGIPGHGRVGFISRAQLEFEITVTGVAGTGAVNDVQPAIAVDGVAGASTLGDYTTESETDPAEVPGVAATGAAGTAVPNIVIDVSVSGTAGTGALGVFSTGTAIDPINAPTGGGRVGSSSFETEISPTGVAATGALGTFTEETEIAETGVAGTGAVHILGESDGSTVRVNVTGIAGIAAVGNVGEEVAVSEVIESGLAGTGAVGTPEPAHGWGDNGWGEEGWGYGL